MNHSGTIFQMHISLARKIYDNQILINRILSKFLAMQLNSTKIEENPNRRARGRNIEI